MRSLRLASYGMRGFVGQSLTPRVAMDFAAAFAATLGDGPVLLARDTRASSPMLREAALAALLARGCEVGDLGICPTPLLQHAVVRRQAAGGLSISGGHSPMGWNALTLVGADGAFLDPVGGEEVLDRFHAADFTGGGGPRLGTLRALSDEARPYFGALAATVDVAAIRAAELTVLIDPVAGAGCAFLEAFARALGFALVATNATPSGYLPRDPEPRPRAALQMASIIRHVRADIGFLLSSDMGRLSVVSEEGEPASEEYSLALVADHVLARHPGTLVTNCCTTRTVDDVARRHGAPVVKTPVGQAFVVSALADEQGVVGGEGSGGVCLPAFSPAFDGFLAMAAILEALALGRCRASELLRALPRHAIVKRGVPLDAGGGYAAVDAIRRRWEREPGVDLTDGVRRDFADGWVHVRLSRTQEVVRVLSEADRRDVAEGRAEELVRLLGQR